MLFSKTKLTCAVLLAALLAGAASLTSRPADAAPTQAAAPPPARDADKTQADDSLTYGGRVLGPDDKPVAGAKLSLALPWGYIKRLPPSEQLATSGPDGAFRFSVPKARYTKYQMAVVATAAGYGPAWRNPGNDDRTEGLTLHLVKDDVPVSGRVLDLEGRPVPGATVRLLEILAPAKADLGPWLAAAAAGKGNDRELERDYLNHKILAPDVPGLASSATTDADGRFRLSGVGRERVAVALIEGPTLATTRVGLLTRASPPLLVPLNRDDASLGVTTYYGASFTHTAAPTKIVAGVVRDKDTKKPLAGARVESHKLASSPLHGNDLFHTVTDAAGRYRLVGLPKGEGNKIRVIPADDQPYLVTGKDVPDTAGLDPVALDVELKRGVWISGRITDKATGKPVEWANVEYYASARNPHAGEYEGFSNSFGARVPRGVAKEGAFRVVGLPGPGFLAVQASEDYLLANQRDDEEGTKGQQFLNTLPFALEAISLNAVAGVDPAKGADAVTRDVALDPGLTLTGTVVDPDGKPLSGARVHGLTSWGSWDGEPLTTPSFTVRAFNPRFPRAVLFLHKEKGLAGALEVPKEKGTPVTMRLRPTATATGRLVDTDGRPRPGVELGLSFRGSDGVVWGSYYPERVTTDKEGRFRLVGLLPELSYSLSGGKGSVGLGPDLRPGETKDLGDVRTKAGNE